MASGVATATNWFDGGGGRYARFRPVYPPALAEFLSSIVASHAVAVDVGCGSGQLTGGLARFFGTTLGIDPSVAQLAHATCVSGVRYVCAHAEQLPLRDGCADLVVAAQAAHWFDRPRFYGQARRIGSAGARIALVSYGVLALQGDLMGRFQHFYDAQIADYWPPQRRLVDDAYRGIDFPFVEHAVPTLQMNAQWGVDDFLGYVATWSAVRRLREAGQGQVFAAFARDMSRLWGPVGQTRQVTWPIHLRIGELQQPA